MNKFWAIRQNIEAGLVVGIPLLMLWSLFLFLISVITDLYFWGEENKSTSVLSFALGLVVLYVFGLFCRMVNKFYQWIGEDDSEFIKKHNSLRRPLKLLVELKRSLKLWIKTAFTRFERKLDNQPYIGSLYLLIKKVFGGDHPGNGVVQRIVHLPVGNTGYEYGFVTQEKKGKLTVFVPGSPNPTNGRLIFIDESYCKKVPEDDPQVQDTVQKLISIGLI